jgi:hypothetical protein
MASIGRN